MAKTTLLDLVDRLIGNVLQGNVYSNVGNYVEKLGTMVPPRDNDSDIVGKTPAFIPRGITDGLQSPNPAFVPKGIAPDLSSPNPVFVPKGIAPDLSSPSPVLMSDNGLHPLNFNGSQPPHPHSEVAGLSPGRSLFPLSDAIKMHDARNAFTPETKFDGPVAAQVPMVKRAEIYNNNAPVIPFDTQQTIDNVSRPLNPSIPRDEIYAKSADSTRHNGVPPLNIDTQSNNITSQLTPPPDQQLRILDQNDIYDNSKYPIIKAGSPIGPSTPNLPVSSLPKGRPDSIETQKQKMEANSDFKKGESFSEIRRNNIYIPSETAKGIVSNIGGTPDSNPTLGDQQALLQKPPAPSLKFKGPNEGDVPNMESLRGFPLVDSAGFPLNGTRDQKAADELFQKGNFQGVPNTNLSDLKNNLYNNGPPSVVNGGPFALTQGFIGPLRNFDIFAIAHWIRNIGSEVMFLPKWTNNQDDKKGGFQGPIRPSYTGGPNGAETIIKSTQWLAQNLLLASLNTGDLQAYGPTNLVWNPLSLLSTFLPARGISPTERPTIGNMVATYKDNLEISVVASQLSKLNPAGERLLVIRNGMHSQISPVKRLQQLRTPIAPPGYIGTLNGALKTLDEEFSLASATDAVGSVDAILDTKTDQLYAGTHSVHTNLYTKDREYSQRTMAYPLDKFEEDFSKFQKAGLNTDNLKINKIFAKKPFPGAGAIDSGADLTFIAKPFLEFADKRGTNAQDTPHNVDVAFSVLDEEEGVVSKTIDDDKNYMPFMFQDMRDEKEQYLYFRAFLKSLSETFTPDWTEDRYYGRTEPVPIYKGVMRTINLSFDMVAWSPKDLIVLYKKLQKLQSMVYPLYDEKGFLKSGPIIKMRIGDLIATGKNKGLPGYLTSLDFNYDKSIWNIKQDYKVPQHIEASLGFTALHEANPGLYDDGTGKTKVFGTLQFGKRKDGTYGAIGDIDQSNIRKIFQSIKGGK